jgi:hypothetical protein
MCVHGSKSVLMLIFDLIKVANFIVIFIIVFVVKTIYRYPKNLCRLQVSITRKNKDIIGILLFL